MPAMQRYSVSSFTTRTRSDEQRQVSRARPRVLTDAEEAVLSSIKTSGEFTLEKVSNMYAGVRRLRDQK